MQLRSILADQRGLDSLISAGTGSGKTLPITLCTLLDDPAKKKVTIVVSPLKRLQKSQANEFTIRFGIRAVAINEDTPRDSTWWSVSHLFMTYSTCIYSYIYRKTYSPLNTALKCMHKSSLSPLNSYFEHQRDSDTSLAWLFYCDSLHSSLSFLGSVLMRLTHFILLDSLCMVYLHFGLPGENFQSSKHVFGRLYHFFSATFPPHILDLVKDKLLRPGYDYVHVTSNRPNIIYATHQVENSIEDVHNYECFLQSPFNADSQPHVLIFFDDKKLTTKVEAHLESLLPP